MNKDEIKNNVITVGDLRRDLEIYPDDYEIHFEGFNYYRTKKRGDKIVQIELNEKLTNNQNK